MKPMVAPKILENPLFIELMEEGLAIQDQFSAEPVYAKTGKGYLKTRGVAEVGEDGGSQAELIRESMRQ